MTCGIYEIVNTTTDYRYVGQSTHIEERWKEHNRQLNGGRHSHTKLQTAWTQDGADCFEWRILETLSILVKNKDLHAHERVWMHRYKDLLYNDMRTMSDPSARKPEKTNDTYVWPFSGGNFTQRRHHLGPPAGMEERRKVMYSGRRDHIRLAEIEAAKKSKKNAKGK